MNYSFKSAGNEISNGTTYIIECILYRVAKTGLKVHLKLR